MPRTLYGRSLAPVVAHAATIRGSARYLSAIAEAKAEYDAWDARQLASVRATPRVGHGPARAAGGNYAHCGRVRRRLYAEAEARREDWRARHPARATSRHGIRSELMAEEGRPNTGRQLKRALRQMRREGRT